MGKNRPASLSKKMFISLTVLSLFSVGASQSTRWQGYMPEKERKRVIRKAATGSGLRFLMKNKQGADLFWVTEIVARALVSQRVDRERLLADEATDYYKTLRNADYYTFLIYAGSMYRASNLRKEFDPLGRRDFFIQRADNRDVFSKGEVKKFEMPDPLERSGTNEQESISYLILTPKRDHEGRSIVTSLDDKIEVQFFLSDKKVLVDYKVKDLVSNLNDL